MGRLAVLWRQYKLQGKETKNNIAIELCIARNSFPLYFSQVQNTTLDNVFYFQSIYVDVYKKVLICQLYKK